jgi:glycerol-3-phosphate cytidylyltransferase
MGLRVYTGGSFDLYHWAHAEFLKRCKNLAGQDGEVIVSLNTDEFIKAYKGKGLVMTYEERRKALLSCRYVDDVVANLGGADSKLAIELVQPDLVVIGSDWARRDYYAQMQFDQDWLDERGITLCYVPYTQGISSTDIKSRLRFSGKLDS